MSQVFFEASISFSNYLVKIFLQTCFVLGVYVASSNSLHNHVINSEFIWSILMVMCCSSGIPKRDKSWKKYLIFWFMICSTAFVCHDRLLIINAFINRPIAFLPLWTIVLTIWMEVQVRLLTILPAKVVEGNEQEEVSIATLVIKCNHSAILSIVLDQVYNR